MGETPYSGDPGFRLRPGYRVTWLRFLVIPPPARQSPGLSLNVMAVGFFIFSNSLFTNQLIIRHSIILATESGLCTVYTLVYLNLVLHLRRPVGPTGPTGACHWIVSWARWILSTSYFHSNSVLPATASLPVEVFLPKFCIHLFLLCAFCSLSIWSSVIWWP
jgi:hypothetical protein